MSETIIVKRTGQAPLRLRGERVAFCGSSDNNAHPQYSGSPGRSQSVSIYKTAGSKYVAAITNETCWQGEHNTDEAAVFPSAKQCIDYLTARVPGWLLQELIDELDDDEVADEVD